MKRNINSVLQMIIVVALPFVVNAQTWQTENIMTWGEDSRTNRGHSLEELSWIAGQWVGAGLGGEVEEIWSVPAYGHMFGLFRMHSEEGLSFSEFCSISETLDGIEYRVKHFSENFHGWEEKDDYVSFPLIDIEGQTAYFDGATFQRVGDVLTVYVAIGDKGKMSEAAFVYELNE